MIVARLEPLLSIIVPVYNEAATIGAVLDRLLTIDLPIPREIIAVNDGSRDGTAAALDAAAARSPLITAIHQPQNGGKGKALRTAMSRTKGTIVAIQDADLELDPAQLAQLVGPVLRNEADVVYGSRFMRGATHVPLVTRLGNAGLTLVTNVLYGSSLTDMETCYKVFRREIIQAIHIEENRFGFEPEITAKIAKARCRIFEVGISYSGRTYEEGKKIGWKDGVRALYCIVKYNLFR